MVASKHKTKLRLSSITKMEVKGSSHFLPESILTGTSTFENGGQYLLKPTMYRPTPRPNKSTPRHILTDSVFEQSLGKLF